MKKAIREHARDFIAIIALIAFSLVVTLYIVQHQRLRIPILEEKPFELKADFQTAQAVTPGQGQTVRVAGVRVGDISKVELNDGTAEVTMDIDRKFLPVYQNATVLLRPKTGLQDMFLELDPGSSNAPEFKEGSTIPAANTAPDINLDQVLSALDGDTRGYLQMLLVGGGEGLRGRGKDLGDVLGSLGPINRDLALINSRVAERKENLKRLIHNFGELSGRLGEEDTSIASVIQNSNSALSAIADQGLDVTRATALLPGTLSTTRDALDKVGDFSTVLKPTLRDLRPFARKLQPINTSLENLAVNGTPAVRNQIRPFVSAAQGPVKDLGPAASQVSASLPRLTDVTAKLNKLGNMAAYNPKGAEPVGAPGRDEGYLYWLGWLGQVGKSAFTAQDAHGIYRRVYASGGCQTIIALFASVDPANQLLNLLANPLAPLIAPGGPCSQSP
jgi:phospholipid/cholesterol/gamma-HCH transport system substrate-binding protein